MARWHWIGCVTVTDTITITISRKCAEDLVADERTIRAETITELEYAALKALGMDDRGDARGHWSDA